MTFLSLAAEDQHKGAPMPRSTLDQAPLKKALPPCPEDLPPAVHGALVHDVGCGRRRGHGALGHVPWGPGRAAEARAAVCARSSSGEAASWACASGGGSSPGRRPHEARWTPGQRPVELRAPGTPLIRSPRALRVGPVPAPRLLRPRRPLQRPSAQHPLPPPLPAQRPPGGWYFLAP